MSYTPSHTTRITLPDQELLQKTLATAKTEQAAALQLLEYLVEIDLRKLYTIKAHPSLFEYIVKELGFSESQAYERVNVVRLMRAVPEAKEKLEQGQLTITSASQVQRFFNLEKKFGDGVLPLQEKVEILNAVSGKSKRETEKFLFSQQSEGAKIVAQEKTRSISETHTELKFQVSEETLQKLNEVKNLMGNESLARIFDESLSELLYKLKKKQGRVEIKSAEKSSAQPIPTKTISTLPAKSPQSRYISIHTKRAIFTRSKGQCEFTTDDGIRCNSQHRLHFDHIQPYSKNGSNESQNLRHLCAQHNWRAAIDAGLIKFN